MRAWREEQLRAVGWQALFPLWQMDTAATASAFLEAGHQAVLCCVDTTRLDARFSGRAFDAALLADLPAGIDPCGENGEFHTLSFAGPLFATPLALRRGESVLRDGRFQYTDFALANDRPPGDTP